MPRRHLTKVKKQAEFHKACTSKLSAWYHATESVKRNLKAPRTAKFPWYEPSYVAYVGNCTFIVSAYVDAQNSFGAELRQSWTAKIKRHTTGGWYLVSLKM